MMRNVWSEDHFELYQLFDNKQIQHLWCPDIEFDSFKQFCDKFKRRISHRWEYFRVFSDDQSKNIVGFAYCYNLSDVNQTTNLCICFDVSVLNSAFCLKQALKYINYLYVDAKIRKIYAEVFDYNQRCIKLLTALGCEHEGQLKQHQLWQYKYWDLHVYSLLREDYFSMFKTHNLLLKKLSCKRTLN